MSQLISSFADVERIIGAGLGPVKRRHYSLDHMLELLDFLGNPQQKFKVVHVAGTSGKTSTVYYIAALLAATGKHVGLTVSPHIYAMNERVQIGLVPLPEAEFCRRFGEFWDRLKACRIVPTYFEAMVVFAFWEFATRKVDYAVVEVGIGGLLDSTNVFTDPEKVCVITDIGLDHMHLLGETLPEIAAQKAGIIQLHNAIFCNTQDEAILQVIRAHAAQKQADLHIVGPANRPQDFSFLPVFQQRNFGLALAAAQFVVERDALTPLTSTATLQAAHAHIPARMEIRSVKDKTVIVDIAHNGQKLQTFLRSVDVVYPGQARAVLIRMPKQEVPTMCAMLKDVEHLIITSLTEAGDEPPKSFDAEEITAACRKAGCRSFEIVPNPRKAFRALLARPEPVLLVTGSAYMVNHIAPLLP